MSFDAHANFAYSTILIAPDPKESGTSFTVAGGEGSLFSTPPFNITVWPANVMPLDSNAEIMRVTAVNGDVFTVTREQEGTTAKSISIGYQVANTVTAKTITDIEAATGGSGGSVTSVNGETGDVTLDKTDIGLGNVDNTSDATKNAATVTLTNKTLLGPKIDGVQDTNGVKIIEYTANASGVNYLTQRAGSTGQAVLMSAESVTDTDVYLNLQTQGAGTVRANGVDVATTSGTQTLTNKTISGSSNTISNIAESSVTNLVSDLAAKEATANKNVASGYAGLTSSGEIDRARRPQTMDNSLPLLGWRAALQRSYSTPAIAVVLGDSLTAGVYTDTSLETARWTAVYEKMLAEKYNSHSAPVGWIGMDQPAVFPYPRGVHWDTVGGTITSPLTGLDAHGQSHVATEYSEITRNMDGFILYYTAQKTGGASFEVRLDGTLIDTFSTTDGTLTPSKKSGYSKSYSAGTYGSHTVKVTATGAGTAILDGGYFCAGNRTSGVQVHNGGQGGKELNDFIYATNPYPNDHISEVAPHLVIIMLGVNDYYHDTISTSDYVTRLTNLVAEVRTAAPLASILFAHEPTVSIAPATWHTTYRDAIREYIISDGNIAFVDMYEASGAYGGAYGDTYSLAGADSLHPKDTGHYLLAHAMFAATALTAPTPLLEVTETKQPLDSDLTTIAGLTATTNNFIQSSSSAWASRTPTQVTATLDNFTSSLKGLVPSPTTSTGKLLTDAGWASTAVFTSNTMTLSDGTAGHGKVTMGSSVGLGSGASYNNFFANSSDTQPNLSVGWIAGLGGLVAFGSGGSSVVDSYIYRAGTNILSLNTGTVLRSDTAPTNANDLANKTYADLKLAKASNLSDLANTSTARTNLGVAIGTDVQAWDADLDTIAGLTATTDNFIQAKSSAWASRTPAQVTADLSAFTSSSKGLVPSPSSATGKLLLDSGSWTSNLLFTETNAVLSLTDGTASHGSLKTLVSSGLGSGASAYQVYANSSDTQPILNFGWIGGIGAFMGFGAGGSSAIDTTIARDAAASLTTNNGKLSSRKKNRVTTITSSATPTINTDNCDVVTITALATAITSMTTNLSGTPDNFDKLIIRIKDNGTARAITWGASFEAMGVALPTTTVISKRLRVEFEYDTVTSKWGCVGSQQEV